MKVHFIKSIHVRVFVLFFFCQYDGSVSSGSIEGRSLSPVRSDESSSSPTIPKTNTFLNRPFRKKRPAPKPPTVQVMFWLFDFIPPMYNFNYNLHISSSMSCSEFNELYGCSWLVGVHLRICSIIFIYLFFLVLISFS